MKGLGARIQSMVDLYPVVDSIADIGCDHGYTAIALFEAGKAEKLFACDIGKEPLEMAKKNVRFRGLEDKISCRLGNGLEALEKGECKHLLLSGMGGMLMIQILEKRIEEFETILLSPQSDYEKVRRFLYPYMELVEDCYVKEKNKFYRILLAKKRRNSDRENNTSDTGAKVPELKATNSDAGENNLDSSAISKVEWEFGRLPLAKKDPVLKELLEDEERHLEEMLLKNPQKVLEEKLERVKEGLGYFR
nr:class I SAM-dependent methyltransferase [uncultured Oribacterium sp.]